MRVLFVHHTFPAQFCHLAPHLAAVSGNEVLAVGEKKTMIALTGAPTTEAPAFRGVPGVKVLGYDLPPADTPPSAIDFPLRRSLDRGLAVARGARELARSGFRPDLIIAHPAWGEAIFLKDIFPGAKLLLYCEFYFRLRGGEFGFDPEFPAGDDAVLRGRSAAASLPITLETADYGMAPTQWQKAQYPDWFSSRIRVIHDGIDTSAIRPGLVSMFRLPNGRTLKRGEEIVTFVARNLEPHRGFHIFMRAIPEIQRRRPRAHIVIVGGEGVGYSAPLAGGVTYRQRMLQELEGQIDLSRVHFCGWMSQRDSLKLLQISAAHVYLVYPLGLSWSLLEAMASGCVVICSRTGPLEEVVEHGRNGWLVDFFSAQEIANRVDAVLSDPEASVTVREAARRTIVERYDLKRVCLPAQTQLLEEIAG